MPFIDCKITKKLNDGQKEGIKSALGSAIVNLHKTESYLMVGIDDDYDLYFAGKKLEAGAFVDVRAFGEVSHADCDRMTAAICSALSSVAGIRPSCVYVTYRGYADWGWNGGNF